MNIFLEDIMKPIDAKDLKENSTFRIEWIRRKILEISDLLNMIKDNDRFFLIPGDKLYYGNQANISSVQDVLMEMNRLFLTTSSNNENDNLNNKYLITKVDYLCGNKIDRQIINVCKEGIDYNKICECIEHYTQNKEMPLKLDLEELKLYSFYLYYRCDDGNFIFSKAIWNSYQRISKYCCLKYCNKVFENISYIEYCNALIGLLNQLHLFVEVTVCGEQKYRSISISDFQIILLLLAEQQSFDVVTTKELWDSNIARAYDLVGINDIIKAILNQLKENMHKQPKV